MSETLPPLPAVREDMAGAFERLSSDDKESVQWMTAHCYVRDGKQNEDGSRGSLRMRGHKDLADLLAYAILGERERCAKLAEAEASCGCNGKHGRCTTDDGPLAIAAAIRGQAIREGGEG